MVLGTSDSQQKLALKTDLMIISVNTSSQLKLNLDRNLFKNQDLAHHNAYLQVELYFPLKPDRIAQSCAAFIAQLATNIGYFAQPNRADNYVVRRSRKRPPLVRARRGEVAAAARFDLYFGFDAPTTSTDH